MSSNDWIRNALTASQRARMTDEEIEAVKAGDRVTLEDGTVVEAPVAEESAPKPVLRTPPVRRPSTHVRKVDRGSADLEWEPCAVALYSIVDGTPVLAGEAFAVVRPGWERWPLGIVSNHYHVTSHTKVDAAILASGAPVTPNGILVSGHGYHVAYGYRIQHMHASDVAGSVVSTKLIVAHDHTEVGAVRASMVLYIDEEPVGALVTSRALHIGAQMTIWQGVIDGMIEAAVIAQDAVLDLLRAAKDRVLTDADRDILRSQGLVVRDSVKTALDAIKVHHVGYTKRVTWNVWARRMNDDALRAVIALLGKQYGDARLRSRPRYAPSVWRDVLLSTTPSLHWPSKAPMRDAATRSRACRASDTESR